MIRNKNTFRPIQIRLTDMTAWLLFVFPNKKHDKASSLIYRLNNYRPIAITI